VRSVTTREPEWTEQDRAEILALAYLRAQLCPCGCGLKAADTLQPEATGPVFVPEQTVCQARMRLLEAQRAVVQDRGSDNAPARLWAVKMRRG
jgi:hypothetical protein